MIFFFSFLALFLGFIFFIFLKKIMKNTFKALSYDLLEKNQQSFFSMASAFFEKASEGVKKEILGNSQEISALLNPLKESLKDLSTKAEEVEKQRALSFGSLSEQIRLLKESEESLKEKTLELSSALKSPTSRGSWGEMHLLRVVELAGLKKYCDFDYQRTLVKDDQIYRPDLIVKLPDNRAIIIDAKAPLSAYLEAQMEKDEKKKEERLKEHALQVKNHIKLLSKKNYFQHLKDSMEYVILFLPQESFLSVALQIDPTLLEESASLNVVLATPTTLIAILRAIALSWKEHAFLSETKAMISMGKELYERLTIFHEHFSKIGKNIAGSVDAYNDAVGSFESRLLPSVRKFNELSSSKGELDLKMIDKKLSKMN